MVPGGRCAPSATLWPMSIWPEDLPGVVTFPDGRRVRGRGLRGGAPAEGEEPELGLYLLPRRHHEDGWPVRWIEWPDYRLPAIRRDALATLHEVHAMCATTRVEVACLGGKGRTGTALALLARLSGVPAHEAVAWTREHYRPEAVETPWQRRFVRTVDLGV